MPVHDSHFHAISAALTGREGRAWFHGTDCPDGRFQRDGQHPGLWISRSLRAALWYAHHPQRDGVVHVMRPPARLPSLLSRTTLSDLCAAAGLPVGTVRRAHEGGMLYLSAQEQLCSAARQAGYPGLKMRDDTQGPHLSAVLWTATPDVTRSFRLCPDGRVHSLPVRREAAEEESYEDQT